MSESKPQNESFSHLTKVPDQTCGASKPLDQTPPPFSPSDIDPSDKEIDGFKIIKLLGQGGMGQVFMAEQSSLRRIVALKLIRPDTLASPTAIKRFRVEAEAIARINHPGIVQVYDVGESNGLPYMVLEYVPGRTLKDMLLRKGTLDEKLTISLLVQVAKALDRANEAGVIHRDIKPENILLNRKGQAKVADFGLARFRDEKGIPLNLTQEGLALGTPLYMSPEQVEGRQLDIRTDIYSLGVTAYHMLAGAPPFQGKNQLEVALLHVQGKPEPLEKLRPDLSPGLVSVVKRMMARKPDHRYQTPAELLGDLQKVSKGLLPLPGPNQSFWIRWGPRLGPWLVFASSVVLTLLVGRYYFHGPQMSDIHLGQDLLVEEQITNEIVGRRETILRDAARGYIQGAGTGSQTTGLALCLDLGLLYLNQGHWDEAESFFKECDNDLADPSYQALGKLGLGIVYALKNRPQESIASFKALSRPELRDRVNQGILRIAMDRKAPTGGARKNNKSQEKNRVDQGAMLRFWLSEAFYYNRRNGKSDSEVPGFLKRLIPDLSKTDKG